MSTPEKYENYKNVIVMDIDDTLSFSDGYGNAEVYANAKPNVSLIEIMKKLVVKGYRFHLYTARGYISCDENVEKAEKKYRAQIETWLKKYNVPYERLIFGKPFGILYVDDKAITPDEFIEKFK